MGSACAARARRGRRDDRRRSRVADGNDRRRRPGPREREGRARARACAQRHRHRLERPPGSGSDPRGQDRPAWSARFRGEARHHRHRAPILAGRLAGRRERASEGDHRHADDGRPQHASPPRLGRPGRRPPPSSGERCRPEAAGLQAAAPRVRKPRQVVQTGVHATGPNRFGVLVVSTAARPWEKLSTPERVSWFPAGSHGSRRSSSPRPARRSSPRRRSS